MTVSALVITLSRDSVQQQSVLAGLRADAALTLGPLVEGRLPVVLDARSAREGRAAVEALQARPGVEFVDVVQIHFEEEE